VNTYRRFLSLAFLCSVAALAAVTVKAAPAAPANPGVRSEAVLVLDGTDGSVLYSRHATEAAPIASITKLMTALVVLEGMQPLDEELEITAADRASTQSLPSRLPVGTRLTRRELLQLALMSSENRAAQALGRSYAGGETAFVRAMNAKARELGMTQARFADPTGLSEQNVASPSDLARLVLAADHSALIQEYSTTASRTVTVGRRQVEFRNTNPLVRDPNWEVSVQKTGHIAAAGQCLVLQARIAGRPIVMVLLNSVGKYTRVADARRIRQWMGPMETAVATLVPTLAPLPQAGSSQSASGT
jgi:serine-type D-Ala-D-Ala endopeptidase (penicillin-binding protein 7)